jgi:hypothetical protein
MTETIQDYDDSNRSMILGNAILPYLTDGMTILDVGCGYAAFPRFQGTILPRIIHDALDNVVYHGIDHRQDVIERCVSSYQHDWWTVIDASAFVPASKYDAVFHLGFDRKDLSNAWKIHSNLLAARKGPRIVLLEAGSPVGIPSKHVESFVEVQGIYAKAGYEVKVRVNYLWSYKVTQPERRFVIMRVK